ncbi:hypothetical protein RB2150_00924 [Rhodobacterales bacterium HTCC2150]|nr:hypothetical protein RB2150_00924 [Rhodobacterales bacterium HTCC2150] [Rhodobacteraceae bacterium HTCC2150]
MKQPEGHHLAEINVGRLIADVDDPRVAEFMKNLDRINGLGMRMPGFVWIMQGETAGNTDTKIDDDPRYVPNLTVWEDQASLRKFVFDTVHKQFFERRTEWFEILDEFHFAMWWVPIGTEPTLDEALERLNHRRKHGDSEFAFGWDAVTQK